MLTLCLVAFSARKMERRIRIILMAHGQVGPAMAEVVNHVLQDDNAIGFSMGWDEPNERVLERAIRLVQQVDEGLGCLLLVDMGSLASFAPEISLRTGVSVRCVARVDTLMALDAVNRASFRDKCTLDELADALEIGRLHAGFSDLEQRTGKPSAILTVCITGEGYARRIESFLKATVVECSDIKIVDVGLLNRDAMLARVEELRRDYDELHLLWPRLDGADKPAGGPLPAQQRHRRSAGPAADPLRCGFPGQERCAGHHVHDADGERLR